jgi:hypothetical protein
MTRPNVHAAIHSDWLRPGHPTLDSTPWRFSPRVEAGSRSADNMTRRVEQGPADPRPYSDAAARAMAWVLPPEPRDADEASQQISDYFDAVAAALRRLEEQHPVQR